ncbi:hypothetical protein BX666DRAFT_1366004 [Dichotomocladium elegans]|nr:hypothetical protein BX666DRAFT_1366004 [Dichotomocladium elegans]
MRFTKNAAVLQPERDKEKVTISVSHSSADEKNIALENETLKHQLEQAHANARYSAEQWGSEKKKLEKEILKVKTSAFQLSADLRRQKLIRNEYKAQALRYKKQAFEKKVQYEEALAWTYKKTIDGENERNRIRSYVNMLRKELIENIPLLTAAVNDKEQHVVDEVPVATPNVPQYGQRNVVPYSSVHDYNTNAPLREAINASEMPGSSKRALDVNPAVGVSDVPPEQSEKTKAKKTANQVSLLSAMREVPADKEPLLPVQQHAQQVQQQMTTRENIGTTDRTQKQDTTEKQQRGEALQPKDGNLGAVERAQKKQRLLRTLKELQQQRR